MSRKLIYPVVAAALFLFGVPGPAPDQARAQSLFNSLKKKAGDLIEAEKEKALSPVTKPVKKAAEKKKTAKKTAKTAEAKAASSGAAETEFPTSSRNIARAVLKIAPEILDVRPDYQVKQLVRIFYPEENEILSNEFAWRKKKDDYFAEMRASAKDAPTRFEVAPWVNNRSSNSPLHKQSNDLVLQLGRYDFDREAWPIYALATHFTLPWIYRSKGPVLYQIVGASDAKTYWLPMSSDKAAELDSALASNYRLYAHYRFAVTDVIGITPEDHPDYEQHKKYMIGKHKEQIIEKLTPVAQVRIVSDRVDLYRKTVTGNSTDREDYQYVTSLDIGQGAVVTASP